MMQIRTQLSREVLFDLYILKKYSVAQISKILKFSQSKINYWIEKYGIEKRTISDAVYIHKNPGGDPFAFHEPVTLEEGILFGLGLGLYWGEGTKRGKGGMRISNTDINLMKIFIDFLERFFAVDRHRLRFSIQIFPDISPEIALDYWAHGLNINNRQFYKPMVIKVRGNGTYKYKSKFGVVIMYLNNTKLKHKICSLIENIR